MQSLRDKLDVCSDSAGDVHAVEVQLERLQVGHQNTYSHIFSITVLTNITELDNILRVLYFIEFNFIFLVSY